MPKNLYRRGKVWWGRVQVAGREYSASMRTVSRPDAQERLDAWSKRLVDAARFGIVRHTWDEAVLEWGKVAMHERIKPSTAKRYLSSLAQVHHILTGMDVRAIDRKVLARVANRPGPTPATRKRDVTAVLAILKQCARWEWIDDAPALPDGFLVEKQHVVVLPDEADVQRLVAACGSAKSHGHSTLASLVLFLRQTGVRLEEAATLTWRQIDLNRSAITLYHTKGGRPRSVGMSAQAVGTLRGLKRRLDVPWVFWHGDAGDRYHNLSSRLAAIGARCKPPIPFRIHDLRHLYAVEFMRGGGSLYTLRDQLGHRSTSTTEGYLRYLTPEEVATATRAIGA